jgi:hypothetical protein
MFNNGANNKNARKVTSRNLQKAITPSNQVVLPLSFPALKYKKKAYANPSKTQIILPQTGSSVIILMFKNNFYIFYILVSTTTTLRIYLSKKKLNLLACKFKKNFTDSF